jgi:hypothetical protein
LPPMLRFMHDRKASRAASVHMKHMKEAVVNDKVTT